MQQNNGNIEFNKRQPEIPVDEAWSMMNELLDANLPVQKSDDNGFVIPKRLIVIGKILASVGCAAAAFVGFHHWVAPVWPTSEITPSTEIHANVPRNSNHLQPVQNEIVPEIVTDSLNYRQVEGAVNKADVYVADASLQKMAVQSVVVKNENLSEAIVEKLSSVGSIELKDEIREVADNQHVVAVDSVDDVTKDVVSQNLVSDSLSINKSEIAQNPVSNSVTHENVQNSDPRWAVGLQLPVLFPTQGSGLYFMQTNGKKQPAMNLIPEIWLSASVGMGQEMVFTLSPYKRFFTGDLVVDEIYRPAAGSMHRHENIMNQSKVVMASGVGLACHYQYKLNSHWKVGTGIGYTRITKALMAETTFHDTIPATSERMFRSLKVSNDTMKIIKPNHFTAQIELSYNYQRWSFGAGVQLPLNQFVEDDYRQVSPVNWQLMVRYALWRKV